LWQGCQHQGIPFFPDFWRQFFLERERYAVGLDGMESLEALHGEIAEDLKSLFETGFNAQASIFFNGLDVRSCAFTFLIW
jgi:hypothetical protein